MDPFRLEGETALITGGGTGLGLAIAGCMVKAGARVVVTGRREATLREAVESLGSAASYECFDVTHCDKAPAVVDRLCQRVGRISILINNAGVHLKKPAVETSIQEFNNILNIHLLGAFALSKACAPQMIESGGGSIVFISSMAAILGIPLVVAYTAAKSALVGLTRSLATELSPEGVRVNAIAPGWIDTDMVRKAFEADPERERRVLARTPMHRLGEPDDIGHAAVYLCSPAAKFVSGCLLTVDGGAHIGF